MSLSAPERVIALLRTVDEARVAWDARSSSGGALLMPSMWHEGSYAELERCLVLMREGGEYWLEWQGAHPVATLKPPQRRLWWHMVMRFRYGSIRTVTVALRRTRLGPELVLPPRCELVAGDAVLGTKNALARVYLWSDNVDENLAQRGVRELVLLMHGGCHERIQLPVSVLQRALGLPVEDASDLEAVPA